MSKNKKRSALLMASCCLATMAMASQADTLRNYNIEEVVVVASPKETSQLKQQPISATLFGREELKELNIQTVKGLSAFAPNFFMPEYGSRITSAIYIRGIGSRMNTPAVGLYVDNVPYTDKSAYDFSFLDVERVDVMRGPQGTLYGRNTMGGLVRVFTADPLQHEGTDVNVGGSTRNGGHHVKAVTYLHPSDHLAFSLGGFYEGNHGFFRNTTTGEHADGLHAGGGKLKGAWKPQQNLRFDLSASYEYSDEGACPYFYLGEWQTEKDSKNFLATAPVLGQNRPSNYRRELLNTSLGVEWKAPKFTLSSITAWQHLNDRLFMDQDFIDADIFSLTQQQRIHALTEEISLKSNGKSNWQWTSGAYFMYQDTHTECPVNFYADGMTFLNNQFAAVLPQRPPMSLMFTSEELPFVADLSTPSLNAALFHQSTLKLGAGLSATVGLRLDYDYRELHLKSGLAHDVNYHFAMPAFGIQTAMTASPVLNGHLYEDSWQLLPKFALQYDHQSGRGNVYVAVSKGYRSGGYNIQAYSDLAQTMLRRDMMTSLRDYCVNTINAMPMPDAQKQGAIAGMTSVLDPNIPATPQVSELSYKPEQSWNYEIGGHLQFMNRRLHVDYTLFYMQTKDQQLARFSESGMGRVMVNAGESESYGAEVAVRSSWLDGRLNIAANYGYTHAELSKHNLGTSHGEVIDYSGNRVPFAPEHTLGADVGFRQPVNNRVLKALSVGTHLQGAGKIYWDEANSFSQPFYATLGARLGAEFAGDVEVELWGRNLTGAKYHTFSFESMNRRFAQMGGPRHFGVDLRWHF